MIFLKFGHCKNQCLVKKLRIYIFCCTKTRKLIFRAGFLEAINGRYRNKLLSSEEVIHNKREGCYLNF